MKNRFYFLFFIIKIHNHLIFLCKYFVFIFNLMILIQIHKIFNSKYYFCNSYFYIFFILLYLFFYHHCFQELNSNSFKHIFIVFSVSVTLAHFLIIQILVSIIIPLIFIFNSFLRYSYFFSKNQMTIFHLKKMILQLSFEHRLGRHYFLVQVSIISYYF